MDDYPDEIYSCQTNQARGDDLLSPSKKRKFHNETKEQLNLQKTKHVCRETLAERGPLQTELCYTNKRKGKAPYEEVDEDLHTREESTQDSNSMARESFSQSTSSYDEPSWRSTHPGRGVSGDAHCSMDSSVVNRSYPGDDEVQGRIQEEAVDEFGSCLTYLESACGSGSSKLQTDEEFEEFLYMNGMIPRSSLLASEDESMAPEQVDAEAQSSTGYATIDQEFEEYFSTLML